MKNAIVNCFREHGCNLVRCAPIERFCNAVIRELLPECRTVIGAAFRQLRGARRFFNRTAVHSPRLTPIRQ